MEHISVKKKVDRLIITHKMEKNERVTSGALDIINKEEIPALLPVHFRKLLMGKELRFVVQNYEDLRTFLKSNICFDLFAYIVLKIIETLQSCEAHGIWCGNLELNSDLVFYDYGKRQVHMIYWPLNSTSEYPGSDASSFFMEMGSIYASRSSRSSDNEYRLRYLQFFEDNSRARFDLEGFKQHVEMLLKQWKEDNTGGGKPGIKDPGPTGYLWEAWIQRVSTGTRIEVCKYPFSIGRRAEFCDYAIRDNAYISKKHVTIQMKNGQVYIRDNGSSNGTYLNGMRLPANTDFELTSGVCFRMGNEDFIYHAAGG